MMTIRIPTVRGAPPSPLAGSFRRSSARAALGVLLLLASTLGSGQGFARENDLPRTLKGGAPPAYEIGRDGRRAELRRALVSGAEMPSPSINEPRRLSREQRDLLNQELREAMRDAYRPRSVVDR